MRTLDPWVSLGTACAVTSEIRLSTAVALPVEHDPITLAKSIATLDHLSGGRVSVGVGFGWNTDELADHGVPAGRRRTALREYLEAMRALWTQDEAAYDGEFVKFGPSWAWPKPVQSHIPVLVGAAGTEKNFKWIARSADGWITTPRDFDIDEPVRLFADVWADAGREGAPQIVALDFKPVPEKLARWAELGVTEVLFGLPDRSADEVAAYIERLAGKLAATVQASAARLP
jgi:probable F420-dependent oxidoreductase